MMEIQKIEKEKRRERERETERDVHRIRIDISPPHTKIIARRPK